MVGIFLFKRVLEARRELSGGNIKGGFNFFRHFSGLDGLFVGSRKRISEGDGFGVLFVLVVGLFDELLFEEGMVVWISHKVCGLFLVTGHDRKLELVLYFIF